MKKEMNFGRNFEIMKDLEKTLTELEHYQTEFNAIQEQIKKEGEEFINKIYEIAEGTKMKRYLVCFWVTGETMPRNEEIEIPNYEAEKYVADSIIRKLRLRFWTNPVALINYWEIL